MIYAIWIIVALIILLSLVVYNYKLVLESNKATINKLNETLIEWLNKPMVIWIISKYSEEDITLMKANKEVVWAIMKYLEYQIAVKTDLVRNMQTDLSTEEKIWYLNSLHETHLFLYKIFHEQKKKEEYSWQEII